MDADADALMSGLLSDGEDEQRQQSDPVLTFNNLKDPTIDILNKNQEQALSDQVADEMKKIEQTAGGASNSKEMLCYLMKMLDISRVCIGTPHGMIDINQMEHDFKFKATGIRAICESVS